MIAQGNDVWRLAKYANELGRNGKRLVGIQELPTSACSGALPFVLLTDDGPSLATDND